MSEESVARTFERCMSVGGVAVFPADTVYGLACDPGSRVAVERLYAMKRRSLEKPSAVMFFELELALEALRDLGPRTRGALERLLPGPVSVLLENPMGLYPLSCGADQRTLGLRVVRVPELAGVHWPVLQSSANLSGGPDARRLQDVPPRIRDACEMLVDGGELPGTPSTVVDLRGYERDGEWRIVRAGGLAPDDVRAALGSTATATATPPVPASAVDPGAQERHRFDPDGYTEMIRADIEDYDELQAQIAAAAAGDARRILDLGTGTGETALRLLAGNATATLVGVDESPEMLRAAAARLPRAGVTLHAGRLEDPLPDGRFDLVASALCVHHLAPAAKRDLFARIHAALVPGGRFVLGDLVVPLDPADAVIELTPGYDLPDRMSDQVVWLVAAGFSVSVAWSRRDLAVLVADAVGADPAASIQSDQ